MDATVEAVKILQELPPQLGDLPWKPGAEVDLGLIAAHAVRQMCDRQPRRVRAQDYHDLQRFSFDGLLWDIRRGASIVRERGGTSPRLWAGAFLCGAMVRAAAERRRDLVVQVGRAMCEMGLRSEAECIWRGISPRMRTENEKLPSGGRSVLS